MGIFLAVSVFFLEKQCGRALDKYIYQPSEGFESKLERIRKNDPPGYDRIMKVIHRLLENPDDADGKMHGAHNGRLKKYVGRRDYRLIYYWCELCRKANRRLESTCAYCDRIHDRSVVFFDIYHKKDSKKAKHA